MLFEEDIHALFEKGDLIHEEGQVQLFLDLLLAFVVLLHPLPGDLDINLNQYFVDEQGYKI